MRRGAKLLIIGAAGILIGAAVLAAIVIMAVPRYLNTPAVRTRIESILSQRLGGSVAFVRVRTGLFPLPHLVLERLTASISETMLVSIPAVDCYPRVASLFRGEVLLAGVRLRAPRLVLHLPPKRPGPAADLKSILQEQNVRIRRMLAAAGPGLHVLADDGSLELVKAGRRVLALRGVKAGIKARPDELRVQFQGTAAPGGAFSIAGRFLPGERTARIDECTLRLGQSSVTNLSASIDWNSLLLRVQSVEGSISFGDLSRRIGSPVPVPQGINPVSGILRIAQLRMSGPLLARRGWKIAAQGSIEDLRLVISGVSGPVLLRSGAFNVTSRTWSVSRVQASFQDSSLLVSGSVRITETSIDRVSFSTTSRVGRETVTWLFARTAPKSAWMVRAPIRVDRLRVAWRHSGMLSVKGNARIEDGPAVALDLIRTKDTLDLKRLVVSDRGNSAEIKAASSPRVYSLSFSGRLEESTIRRIFPLQPAGTGVFRGDLRANISRDQNVPMDASGTLRVNDFVVPWGLAVPLTIEDVVLRGDGPHAIVQNAAVRLGDSHYQLAGTAVSSGSGITVDGDVSADRIDVSELAEMIADGDAGVAAGSAPRPLTVSGAVRVSAREVRYADYRFTDVSGRMEFGPGTLRSTFTHAKVCGLAVAGTIDADRQGQRIALQTAAAGANVTATLDCLTNEQVHMSGTFDLQAELRTIDRGKGPLQELNGRITYDARDGKIYRYPLLARILSVFSVTELLRGKVPQLGGDGFPYHTANIVATIEQGRMKLEKAVIDGSSLTIIAQGDIDLRTRKADLVVLVAPFSTINWIIRHIPLVGRLLGGTLISIPAKVTGNLDDPDVVFLAPSAVGSRIVALLEDILNLPVEIVSPLLPKKKDGRQ